MKYSLYNKERFLKNDEVVIDQEGNFLVLADGDAPNYINNRLDIDVLRHTDERDSFGKNIIDGDVILLDKDCLIVNYNSGFELVDFTQEEDGEVYFCTYGLSKAVNTAKNSLTSSGRIKRVTNIYEGKSLKKMCERVMTYDGTITIDK
jgi:hypothetical protein